MSDSFQANGSCLCGSVRFHAAKVNPKVGVCHCGMCRKWSGGPWMTVDAGTELTFEDKSHIATYDSSPWAERGFCARCGANLFYRLKQSGQYIMSVDLFDNHTDLVFDHQVFIDKKPSYYCFSNQTQDMTEAEVFAKYAPPPES